ncbi:hypothetical protein [Microbacterium alcoholitolerans]|uniref:hypothetical protein n=1 Tax=unclassified Microbacterium TaxID=2609290 RepID=UPI003D174852
MSTSDQDGHARLTRKQLREIRLTGSTPVITEQDAADAASESEVAPQAPAEPSTEADSSTEADLATETDLATAEPAAEDPAEQTAAPDSGVGPVPTGEVPLTRREMREQERLRTAPLPAAEPVPSEPASATPADDEGSELVSGIPTFTRPPSKSEHPRIESASVGSTPTEPTSSADAPAPQEADADRPMVGAAFGIGVTNVQPKIPAAFDDLLGGDAHGSHRGGSALIFTPSPGVGSLSGPIASTGEMLVTGSYSLPAGIGSQGHAIGFADGKDADAVLIDGELAPASSPTPIAASSAVATSKPAGEVIRPPAPDSGNKLMLTLAIVAGGLALALAAALIFAFTTNVFG